MNHKCMPCSHVCCIKCHIGARSLAVSVSDTGSAVTKFGEEASDEIQHLLQCCNDFIVAANMTYKVNLT